jgi:hypothetical protein
MTAQEVGKPTQQSFMVEIKGGNDGIVAQNSFSADSPYFGTYVENEIRHMAVMHDTLHDIASRTKTFGKCGSLMSEATRRLALSCRLRRPYTVEDEKEGVDKERRERAEVLERRRALGEEMTSLLIVMSEVSHCRAIQELP